MQGAFFSTPSSLGAGVDWAAALDPGADEASETARRHKVRADEILRIAQNRRAAAAGVAVPVRAVVVIPNPIAASHHFELDGRRVYLVREQPDTPLRNGLWGHYLVPYETFQVAVGGAPNIRGRPYLADPLARFPVAKPVGLGGPGRMPGDPKPMPSAWFCEEGVHYVCAVPGGGAYSEVGLNTLRRILETAETQDQAFARRMEGLGNVDASVTWNCLDPDYDALDRPALMEQFMSKYLDRFYSKMEPANTPDVRALTEEALHKHRVFCKAWTQKHYKTLTPAVTAPGESLAGEFWSYFQDQFPLNHRLTRTEFARVLMRHEDFASDFASCLHYYSTSLEQTRGGRNANYRQMAQINASKAWSYNRLGNLLAEKSDVLRLAFQEIETHVIPTMHPLLVDWHTILGQMPQVHRYFDDSAAHNTSRMRRTAHGGQVPPWKFARGD